MISSEMQKNVNELESLSKKTTRKFSPEISFSFFNQNTVNNRKVLY